MVVPIIKLKTNKQVILTNKMAINTTFLTSTTAKRLFKHNTSIEISR